MIFLGHFISLADVAFTEYKWPSMTIYFLNDSVFKVTCTEDEYKEFLTRIEVGDV